MEMLKISKTFYSVCVLLLLLSFITACSGGGSKKTFTVSTTSGGNGNISPLSIDVKSGETATFALTPDNGFVINNVTGCGGNLNETSYTTAVVTSACTVTASFTPEIYTVTTAIGNNGEINPTTSDVAFGEAASFTLTPDEGFVISSVSGCNGTLDDNSYTIGQITENCEISASFDYQLADGEVLAEDFYLLVSNTVKSSNIDSDELLLAFYNFEIVSGADTIQRFQIGYSLNDGQTYHLLVPDTEDVSTIISDGSSAYPRAIVYGEYTVLLAVSYRTTPDTSISRAGIFIIDRETLEISFKPDTNSVCSPNDGIQYEDGSWLFVGSCDSNATIYRTDVNLENRVILEQLTSNSYGGQFVKLFQASDGCLYAGGHNWEVIDSESATHINIRRSCDQGDTWELDLDYYNAGHAYTSMRTFFELNNQIQIYGHIGETDGDSSTDVTVVTAQRNAVNDWTFNKLPGTTVSSSSPAYFIAVEENSCLMVSVSLLTVLDTSYSVSNDCGLNWSDPIPTDFGRVTGIRLTDGIALFYHYNAEFHVDQIDLN